MNRHTQHGTNSLDFGTNSLDFGLLQFGFWIVVPSVCIRYQFTCSVSCRALSRARVSSGSVQHLSYSTHGRPCESVLLCGGSHLYTPIEERTEKSARHHRLPPSNGLAWLLYSCSLRLILVGSSLKTSAAVLSSQNQRLREGSSAASLHSEVVVSVR